MGEVQGLHEKKASRPWVEMLGVVLFRLQDNELILCPSSSRMMREALPTAGWLQVKGRGLPPSELFVLEEVSLTPCGPRVA